MPKYFEASAPGSLMLFGEHHVLRGGTSIVAAVDRRIVVTIEPDDGEVFFVRSSLGSAATSIHSISLGHTFRFIEKSLRVFQGSFPSGAIISIRSEIDHTVGLGSSAAVTVATLAATRTWLGFPQDTYELLAQALDVITSVQGCGSGADAASIIWGGVIGYAMHKQVKPLQKSIPLVLAYSGKKTPTPDVIAYVSELETAFPEIYASLFSSIEQCVCEAERAFMKKDLQAVGKLMTVNHGLMEALGVGTEALSTIFWNMVKIPTIYGAKISGSGLGDCVVGLGEAPLTIFEKGIPIKVSPKGVMIRVV